MRAIRSMMATLLVAVMACLPLLGSNGAMLLPVSGGVQVNGQPLAAAGTAIAAGDQVAIDSRGTARMVIPGGTIIAAAKTNFRLEKNQAIRLGYGMLKIAGHVPVLLNTRSVIPASSDARYIVTALNGPVYVQAVSGTVLIRRGRASYAVKSGEAAMFQDTNAAPAQTTQTPDQNAGQAATPPDQNAPPAATQTQTQTQTTTTTDQNAAPAQTATPDQNAPPAQTATPEQNAPPAPATEQNAPAPAQTTTETTTGGQTTTTSTTTTTETQQPTPSGSVSPTVAVPVAVGIIAAAAAVTGVITYEVTKCSNCIKSPSQ